MSITLVCEYLRTRDLEKAVRNIVVNFNRYGLHCWQGGSYPGTNARGVRPYPDARVWFEPRQRLLEPVLAVFSTTINLHQVRVTPTRITLSTRFDQIRASLLVRHLARERRRSGCDNLEPLTDAELKGLLDRLLPRTPVTLRRIAHSTALCLAEVPYCTSDYRRAWKRLLDAVRLDPLAPRNWRRAWRLLICLLMPTAVTRRLKALYGGWA